jgi:translation initiation factor IF-3
VIAPDGEQLGILPIAVALKKAEELVLDLVEVGPNSTPPVCKIMDFGKYQYEKSKKMKEGKKKQHTVQVKEIRLRPKTDSHDLETKLKQARKFLEQKNKVKFTVMFRGRELAYKEMGKELLDKVVEELSDVGFPESPIKLEGRRMALLMGSKVQ